MTKEKLYPKFISNAPCGEDKFEGKSQDKIAENISSILTNNTKCKIIGLDGDWGSGKSNVVKQVEKKLGKEEFHFFVYDAWGHQEDLQRRSILEELTDYLITKKLLTPEEKWKEKLNSLLAKSKTTKTAITPEVSWEIIFSAAVVVLTPIFNTIATSFSETWQKASFTAAPLILYVIYLCRQKLCKKITWSKLFQIYQKEKSSETKLETISENEPSVKNFRDWMIHISNGLGKNKLILIFDNMDRLPNEKVQELWSSIHTFFADPEYNTAYSNVSVIVPFDRAHIKLAFENDRNDKNDKKQGYGDDFINKTFDVVFRVSPPILSNWRIYFEEQWNEAFGNLSVDIDLQRIIQIYEILHKRTITPRNIIAFINEFVSIKRLIQDDDIPSRYVALFIVCRNEISKDPIKQILNPEYLYTLKYLYENDANLPKYITALFYQIPSKKAIDIIFSDKLKNALETNNTDLLKKISQIDQFKVLLGSIISKVENYVNPIESLNELTETIVPNDIWDNLYTKAQNIKIDNQKIEKYQIILLNKIANPTLYLEKILDSFINVEEFNALNYYNSINSISKEWDVTVYENLKEKKTSAPDFIEFITEATSDYKKYKINCSTTELDEHLEKFSIEELAEISFIPYIVENYKLPKYTKHLENLIYSNVSRILEDIIVVYARIKEIKTYGIPVINDDYINSYFQDLQNNNPKDEFYYDLIAMRISRFNSYHRSYISYFEAILNTADESIVDGVSNVIEYYTNYGSLLINLETFGQYPLYKTIVQKLTKNGGERLSIGTVLPKFDMICTKGEILASDLIIRLNNWDANKSIKADNIKTTTSLEFFEAAKSIDNELTKHCFSCLKTYLDSLTKEQWQEYFKDTNSYEFKASTIFDKYKFPQLAKEAFDSILIEIASSTFNIPNKDIWNQLIMRLEKQGSKHKAIFNTIRDKFCSTANITVPLFLFFVDWLFKYADMNEQEKVLSKIFISKILKSKKCMHHILTNKNMMVAIAEYAETLELTSFKGIIADLLDKTYSGNQEFISFAKMIGVSKEKEKDKDLQQ